MNGKVSADSSSSASANSRSLGYWSGFSAFLFVVLLSVFTWVVQRRVAQYETLQQAGGHHLTATKVCLTDRSGIAISPAAETGGSRGPALLIAALLLALGVNTTLRRGCRTGTQRNEFLACRLRPDLTHFFFLPPPPLFRAS